MAESNPNIDLPTEGYYYNSLKGIEVEAMPHPTSQKSQDVIGRARATSEQSWNSNWSGRDLWTVDQSFNSGFLNDRSPTDCITALTAIHRHSGVDLDLGSSTYNPDRHLEASMGRPFYGGSLLAPGCGCPQDDWTSNTAANTQLSAEALQWRPTWGTNRSTVGEICCGNRQNPSQKVWHRLEHSGSTFRQDRSTDSGDLSLIHI